MKNMIQKNFGIIRIADLFTLIVSIMEYLYTKPKSHQLIQLIIDLDENGEVNLCQHDLIVKNRNSFNNYINLSESDITSIKRENKRLIKEECAGKQIYLKPTPLAKLVLRFIKSVNYKISIFYVEHFISFLETEKDLIEFFRNQERFY